MNCGEEYTCEDCGGTFHDERSEADRLMEYQEVFTEEQRADPEGTARVCDNCYRILMAKAKEMGIVA